MGFMQPQIEFGDWYGIDGTQGTEFISADWLGADTRKYLDRLADVGIVGSVKLPHDAAQFCENRNAQNITKHSQQWGARLSAPGYLDCTDWVVFDTEAKAQAYLAEQTEDDSEDEGEQNEIN